MKSTQSTDTIHGKRPEPNGAAHRVGVRLEDNSSGAAGGADRGRAAQGSGSAANAVARVRLRLVRQMNAGIRRMRSSTLWTAKPTQRSTRLGDPQPPKIFLKFVEPFGRPDPPVLVKADIEHEIDTEYRYDPRQGPEPNGAARRVGVRLEDDSLGASRGADRRHATQGSGFTADAVARADLRLIRAVDVAPREAGSERPYNHDSIFLSE